MKKRKETLTGWVDVDWVCYWDTRGQPRISRMFIDKESGRRKGDSPFRKPTKIKVTIEEI